MLFCIVMIVRRIIFDHKIFIVIIVEDDLILDFNHMVGNTDLVDGRGDYDLLLGKYQL